MARLVYGKWPPLRPHCPRRNMAGMGLGLLIGVALGLLAGWAGGRTREAWLIWRRRSTVGTPILWRGVLLGAGLLALVLVLLHH